MSALAWLNDLMQWIGRWVPRLVVVPPTHRAVLFGRAGCERNVGTGLIWYWPLWHSLRLVPVTIQSLQFSSIARPSGPDGWVPRVQFARLAVQFRIIDALVAATSALSVYAVVENRVKAAWVTSESAEALLESVRAQLAPYGVWVESVDVISCGGGLLWMGQHDWSYSDSEKGQAE